MPIDEKEPKAHKHTHTNILMREIFSCRASVELCHSIHSWWTIASTWWLYAIFLITFYNVKCLVICWWIRFNVMDHLRALNMQKSAFDSVTTNLLIDWNRSFNGFETNKNNENSMIFPCFDCAFQFLFILVFLTALLLAKNRKKIVVENASNGGRSIEKKAAVGMRTHFVALMERWYIIAN